MSRSMISSVSEYINEILRWNGKMDAEGELPNANHGQKSENNARVKEENVFHAIYVPKENLENLQDKPECVHSDKIAALKVIKKFPTARLKSFRSHLEAEKFAKYGDEQSWMKCEVPAYPLVTEIMPQIKPPKSLKRSGIVSEESNFKGPKAQELVAFRKIIENGNLDEVKRIAWENPRYLVSSADTPAILQEGCRYNALHVAVRTAQTSKMCELILSIISDPEFLHVLYGKEEYKTYVDRAEMLLDLYLNTPDKGLNETPLHFAVKFGHLDIVKLLVSYSQCIKTLKNKHDQTPLQMICSRKHQEDEGLKKAIHAFLEEQFFVPVLRSVDNTLQPSIGQPFSSVTPLRLDIVDPLSPPVEVRALAGPMSKEQAVEFRKKWKTPPRTATPSALNRKENQAENSFNAMKSPIANISCRLQDTEKGLERVGRNLAEECSVSWAEFWPFLKDFADLRCPQDLMKLEKYFKSKHVPFYENCPTVENEEVKTEEPLVMNNSMDEISRLCVAMEAATLSDSSDENMEFDDDFYTPLSSPILTDDESDDEMHMTEEGTITFIEGDSVDKMDYAVFNALPQIIDPQQYPYIYLWRHEMQIILRQNPNMFNNKTPLRRKLQLVTPEKSKNQKLIPHKIQFNNI